MAADGGAAVIVQVFLRISGDDGTPALVAESAEMFVQKTRDMESNLFGAMGQLDRMVGEQRSKMVEQAEAYRAVEPPA